jgi:hypothetical protein
MVLLAFIMASRKRKCIVRLDPNSLRMKNAILAPKNENVNYINTQILNEHPGTTTTYKSIDTVTDP